MRRRILITALIVRVCIPNNNSDNAHRKFFLYISPIGPTQVSQCAQSPEATHLSNNAPLPIPHSTPHLPSLLRCESATTVCATFSLRARCHSESRSRRSANGFMSKSSDEQLLENRSLFLSHIGALENHLGRITNCSAEVSEESIKSSRFWKKAIFSQEY